jgi:succinyl-CoA synthetase beta subunit
MNVHEYQAKQLFTKFNIPTTKFVIVHSSDDAVTAARSLGGDRWVVKAQVHAGGRGKAGGVKVVNSLDDVKDFAKKMIGTNLVTYQTDSKGQPVNTILIEQPSDIKQELYLSALIDRSLQKLVIIASPDGGVDIEKVAHDTPDRIYKIIVDPMLGVMPFQCRELGFKLGLDTAKFGQLQGLLQNLVKLIVDLDLSMVEVNPLVITGAGDLICLDGKINVDDNALYRQSEIQTMRDTTQEDARENQARDWELNYIALDGDIGCMVNGAGLAMATMDVIKLHGGHPANFLDVGGGATTERVTEAFKIILSDSNVKGVLVNIFGGIVRCDLIAEGIIEAVKQVGVNVPVVVRLEGNNADKGLEILNKSTLNIIAASNLSDAATKIISAANAVKQ